MTECNKPYTIMAAEDMDIDDLATIPDYFFGMRELEGDLIPVRIPGARVMPTGNLANVIALAKNNEALTVPENQVRAGYIDVQPGGNIMRYADANNRALFLMLGDYTDNKMLIQSSGFLRINGGHQYVPGLQYYVGENGEPVTDETITGQTLFTPLDDYTLAINLGV